MYEWMHWNQYMVIAISKNRMASLGVTVKATTELKTLFCCSSSGVSYITASHSLAEHWIPEEAFVHVFSLDQFMELAGQYQVLEISTDEEGKSGSGSQTDVSLLADHCSGNQFYDPQKSPNCDTRIPFKVIADGR